MNYLHILIRKSVMKNITVADNMLFMFDIVIATSKLKLSFIEEVNCKLISNIQAMNIMIAIDIIINTIATVKVVFSDYINYQGC